jgi:pimeloyl-ACP methyl ester carboxylesterase
VTATGKKKTSVRRRIGWWVLGAIGGVLLFWLSGLVSWITWAESDPEAERALRTAMREQLAVLFPDGMAVVEGEFGWRMRSVGGADLSESSKSLGIVLLHGLDEPGDIWDDVVPALEAPNRRIVEFRYPNDQPVALSADLLAENWARFPAAEDDEVVIIGHSMGGLVARDFVTRYAASNSLEQGPAIKAVILVGTPNHGSEWARFRMWLELRDHFGKGEAQDYHQWLFAGLRDGAGEAKVDLRPGSAFLQELNARPWPEETPLRLIGGLLLPEEATERAQLDGLIAPQLQKAWKDWWQVSQDGIGDGVVTVESLTLPDAAPPIILPASHRGLLRRSFIESGHPPAIPVIQEWISEWEREVE